MISGKITMKKDVVAGLGEIGSAILKLLSKKQITVGYDLDKRLVNESKLKKYQDTATSFLHIAIPVTKKFDSNLLKLCKKFKPECVVIHSTIGPGTTERIQKKLKNNKLIDINYSYIIFGKSKAFSEKYSIISDELNKTFFKINQINN